jgi:hypothetical protein
VVVGVFREYGGDSVGVRSKLMGSCCPEII